jgi:hypothetical protein
MERGNKTKIYYLTSVLNKMFSKHFKQLELCPLDMSHLDEAYFEVFKEMCTLLKADIILDEYYIWLHYRPKPERFRQFHYYINNMWGIIKSTKHDDELSHLTLALTQLLIKEFEFVIDANLIC